MGTRSLVVFEEESGEEICVVYRQFDGYPSGRGKELQDFLKDRHLVNGFGDTSIKQSNGMEDLVAQWIAYEKLRHGTGPWDVGNVYIYHAGTRDCGEEYIYTVKPNYKDGNFDLYAKDWRGNEITTSDIENA